MNFSHPSLVVTDVAQFTTFATLALKYFRNMDWIGHGAPQSSHRLERIAAFPDRRFHAPGLKVDIGKSVTCRVLLAHVREPKPNTHGRPEDHGSRSTPTSECPITLSICQELVGDRP
jgi:hypothetical protein